MGTIIILDENEEVFIPGANSRMHLDELISDANDKHHTRSYRVLVFSMLGKIVDTIGHSNRHSSKIFEMAHRLQDSTFLCEDAKHILLKSPNFQDI